MFYCLPVSSKYLKGHKFRRIGPMAIDWYDIRRFYKTRIKSSIGVVYSRCQSYLLCKNKGLLNTLLLAHWESELPL